MAVLSKELWSNDAWVHMTGDGLYDSDKVVLPQKVPVQTLCGTWAWNADGQYKMYIHTKDSSVMLRYFARRRGKKQGAFTQDSALDIDLTVETTVAGSNKNLDTDTAVKGRTENGKLVISMTNKVKDVAPAKEEDDDPFADLFAGLGLGRK